MFNQSVIDKSSLKWVWSHHLPQFNIFGS